MVMMTRQTFGRPDMITEEEPPDTTVYIRISLPEHKLQRCLQFQLNETIFEAKQRILAFFGKELKDGLNYGLYCPPLNGRAGKFLDEERPLRDYPLPGPIGFLEFKYKRRVYKMMQFNPHKIKKQHTKANLKQFVEAVKHGSVAKVTKFTSKGLDPNFQEAEMGETPLTLATALMKPREMILALVGGGAHLDFRTKRGVTPMHKAAMVGNQEALKVFLELGASPNYRDAAGLTPLYYSVSHEVSPNCVELLLHERSVISIQDEQGWAEIHQSCRYGRVQHLEHLLFYGADINQRNASGNTPLHVCAVNNQESCARVLLFRGADKTLENFSSQTPFQVAIIANNRDLAEVIKSHNEAQVVPFKEPPHYTDRRRSSITPLQTQLVRSRSDPRLNLSHLRDCFDDYDGLTPTNSLISSPSSSTLHEISRSNSYRYPERIEKVVPQRSMSVCSSLSSGGRDSDSLVYAFPRRRLYAALPGRNFVCIRSYKPKQAGELELNKGDIVEVLSVGEEGFWEGKVDHREGWFPSENVQEVIMRRKGGAQDDSVVVKRNTLAALVNTQSENSTICVVLQRGRSGYGFVLRGARSSQSSSSTLEFIPSPDFPALQYLDVVEKNGMADKAGLRKGDFVLEINGENVVRAPHEHAVKLIKTSKDTLAMKVVRVKSAHDGIWTVEHVDDIGQTKQKKRAPAPPKRDPRTSLSVGRGRARSMIDGLAQLEQTLAHYDSDGLSLHSSNSYESLNNTDKHKTASIRSRPSSQKISTQELEDLFARQGSSQHATTGQTYSQRDKPTIAVPVPKYASPAQMRAQKYKHKRKAANSLGVSNSLSTPNLGNVDEVSIDDSDSLSSLSTDRGIVIMNNPSQTNGRRISLDSQNSSSSQMSDNIVIPPPPSYPPPLPPKEEPTREVMRIQPGSDAVYANVSQEVLPAVESSFRPGRVAQLHTPKTVTQDQVMVHQKNNSFDMRLAQHQQRDQQQMSTEHIRTTSLPDHTRIVTGNVHQMAAKFEHNTNASRVVEDERHTFPQAAHPVQSGPTPSLQLAKGVTFADDRVFENAAQFMKEHPNATMLVTAEINVDSVDNTNRQASVNGPPSGQFFTPAPDYDEPSPDYDKSQEFDIDELQKLVSENKAITDSWAKASGVHSSSTSSDQSKTPSPLASNVNIPRELGNNQIMPPPPTEPPPSVPGKSFVKHSKPTPPPPVRKSAVLQRNVSAESASSTQSQEQKETLIIPKPPSFSPPVPRGSVPVGMEGSLPAPPAPPPPKINHSVGARQSQSLPSPHMGMGAVKMKIGSGQQTQTNSEIEKPSSNSALQDALQTAVAKRQLKSVTLEARSKENEKETNAPLYENDLLAAVAKRQARLKDTSGSMVVRNMEKSIEERKKQNAVVASSDPAAALAAAVAKRRSLIDSGATDGLHEKIEKNVAKSRKISTRFGKPVEQNSTNEKFDKDQTSGTKEEIESDKTVDNCAVSPKGQSESPVNTIKKSPPAIVAKTVHSRSSAHSDGKSKVSVVEKSNTKQDVSKSHSAITSVQQETSAVENAVGKISPTHKKVEVKSGQSTSPDKSSKSDGKAGFTAKASEKLEWLKQRRLSQTPDRADVEKAKAEISKNGNLETNGDQKKSSVEKQISVEIKGATTDQSSTDSSSVRNTADELANMLNSVNSKISQLSPKSSDKIKTNDSAKQNENGIAVKDKTRVKTEANVREKSPPKLKNACVAIPPPLGLFDDPTMVETNIDEDVDVDLLPPPPPDFVADGSDSASHRAITDALPPPPPLAFSHNAFLQSNDDAVSLMSAVSTLSTLSSDMGGNEQGQQTLPLHEYSSVDLFCADKSDKYKPLANVPPPPPAEFGDDNPSISSGYGSVIMSDAEHFYEELGCREVLPPPPSFDAPGAPSKQNLKTVIHVGEDKSEIISSPSVEKSQQMTFKNKAIHHWTCCDVGDWLDSLNLSEYKAAFVENMIDGENLSKLTRDEYCELGVTRLGHRMNMERAIKQYQGVRL